MISMKKIIVPAVLCLLLLSSIAFAECDWWNIFCMLSQTSLSVWENHLGETWCAGTRVIMSNGGTYQLMENITVTSYYTGDTWKFYNFCEASQGVNLPKNYIMTANCQKIPLDSVKSIISIDTSCIEQPPECSVASDCEGKSHIQCVGKWTCPNERCVWECDTTKYLCWDYVNNHCLEVACGTGSYETEQECIDAITGGNGGVIVYPSCDLTNPMTWLDCILNIFRMVGDWFSNLFK